MENEKVDQTVLLCGYIGKQESEEVISDIDSCFFFWL